jgi:hypothetical protein
VSELVFEILRGLRMTQFFFTRITSTDFCSRVPPNTQLYLEKRRKDEGLTCEAHDGVGGWGERMIKLFTNSGQLALLSRGLIFIGGIYGV